MTFILIVLFLVIYVQIGYLVADRSLKVWLAKDNSTRLAFLLFPVSFYQKRIGGDTGCMLAQFDFKGKIWDSTSGNDQPGPGIYTLCLMVLWPLRVALNACSAVIFGFALRKFERTGSDADIMDDSNVHVIFARRRSIVAEISRLEQRKARLDTEIHRRETELSVAFEAEASLDSAAEPLKLESGSKDTHVR